MLPDFGLNFLKANGNFLIPKRDLQGSSILGSPTVVQFLI